MYHLYEGSTYIGLYKRQTLARILNMVPEGISASKTGVILKTYRIKRHDKSPYLYDVWLNGELLGSYEFIAEAAEKHEISRNLLYNSYKNGKACGGVLVKKREVIKESPPFVPKVVNIKREAVKHKAKECRIPAEKLRNYLDLQCSLEQKKCKTSPKLERMTHSGFMWRISPERLENNT